MNINPLVKKNKALIVVLLCTAVVSCILGFLCVSVSQDVQTIMDQIEKDDNDIQQIYNKKNPNPVKESEKIITDNTRRLEMRTRELRRRIGYPYRQALQDFLSKMESTAFLKTAHVPSVKFLDGTDSLKKYMGDLEAAGSLATVTDINPVPIKISEDEIMSKFADHYRAYYADRKNTESTNTMGNEQLVAEHKEIFDTFRELLANDIPSEIAADLNTPEARDAYVKARLRTFDKAFFQFALFIQYQTHTAEMIHYGDAVFIFLHALGVPRTMSSRDCKNYIDNISRYISHDDQSFIPGLAKIAQVNAKQDGKLTLEEQIRQVIPSYTYNHKGGLPAPGNVVHILRHYRILEDIYYRMREAGIQVVTTIASPLSDRPTGNLGGDPIPGMDSNYKKFVYEVTVISTVGEIQSFINQLHRAYEQNRIYDIKEIRFAKESNLLKDMDDVAPADEKVKKMKNADRELRKQLREQEKAAADKKKEGNVAGDNSPEGSSLLDPGTVPDDPAKKFLTLEEIEADIYSDADYGAVLIGQKERVTAVIKFDYVVYMGEVLKKE